MCTNVVKVDSRAADGTSWFARTFTNAADVASAKWTVAGLGVFDVFVNGERVGDDFLKPGYTHFAKTKYSFSYDVAGLMNRAADSGVTYTDEQYTKIAQTVKIARKTIGIIHANIIFAIAVKIIILILSVFGIANMWMAIFGDVGVLILCILNAMRLLRRS